MWELFQVIGVKDSLFASIAQTMRAFFAAIATTARQ